METWRLSRLKEIIMKRLYYLADTIESAESISSELHQEGITDWNFHIMSYDKKGLKSHHLHSTNSFVHEHDGIRLAERGALIGVVSGIFVAISFILFTGNCNIFDVIFVLSIVFVG